MKTDVTEWKIKTRYERDQFVQKTGFCYQCRKEPATHSGKCRKCEDEGMAALKKVSEMLWGKGLLK